MPIVGVPNLASGALFVPLFRRSLLISWRTCSISSSPHTVRRSLASRSLSSLCRWITNPPRLQTMAWSTVLTVKDFPANTHGGNTINLLVLIALQKSRLLMLKSISHLYNQFDYRSFVIRKVLNFISCGFMRPFL